MQRLLALGPGEVSRKRAPAASLEEWVEATPGMAELQKEIETHMLNTLCDPLGYEATVRCVMTSVRQAWEARK